MLMFTCMAFAQTDNQNLNVAKEKKKYETVGLSYYGYKGANNYGIFGQTQGAKGWGIEYAFRSSFKKYGNYSLDLGVNYSLGLYKSEDISCFLTLGVGLSYRFFKAPKIDKNGKQKDKFDLESDVFANPRFKVFYKDFMVSLGYSLCSYTYHFGKDYRSEGLFISVGYNI